MQQEGALNKLKDLFDQNDLNELDIHSEEESLLFHTIPPGTPVNIETRGRSRTLPERSTYPETLGQPHLHSHSNHDQQHREQQVEVQQVQQAQDTLFDSTTLGDFSNQNQSAQEPLEALKTVSSLSLEALDHRFMMGASTALLAPGSSASPPPSWLLESDLGVGLVDDPDDGEAENDAADDWSSAQADESGTTTKGVRRVGGRAVGGSRPNSSTSPKYECPLCNRFYTRPFNLRSHMLVHEDKKPFACELCDSRFTRRHDMVRHIKTRHKNQQQDVVGEGMDGGGPAPVAGTGPAAIPLQARSQEERDRAEKDTLEDLQ
ncbi:hypothetical protein BGZ81_010927 [Podila clonocystis]|nr:hypothetical protein BGZ81_010927 [Podila clonocystis]